jgi:hypothetical protein
MPAIQISRVTAEFIPADCIVDVTRRLHQLVGKGPNRSGVGGEMAILQHLEFNSRVVD